MHSLALALSCSPKPPFPARLPELSSGTDVLPSLPWLCSLLCAYTMVGQGDTGAETWGCVSCWGGQIGIPSWQGSASWKYLPGTGIVTLTTPLGTRCAWHGTTRTSQPLHHTTLVMRHLSTDTSFSGTHYFWDVLPREQAPFGQHTPHLHMPPSMDKPLGGCSSPSSSLAGDGLEPRTKPWLRGPLSRAEPEDGGHQPRGTRFSTEQATSIC